MADTRQDTVVDGLKKLFPQIAQLQLASDASQHMDVIQGLQQAIQQYIQLDAQKAAQGQQQMAAQAAQGAAAGGPPGMGSGGPPGMGGGAPGGMGQSPMTPGQAGSPMQAPGSPLSIAPGGGTGMSGFGQDLTSSDELRRMLSDKVNVA